MENILVITGPTAAGKTKLAIELAKKFDGEIISADSRQVYKGNDIETGKDKELYEDAGVPVWGLDIVSPGSGFNVSAFVFYAQKIIVDIIKRGKLPIIVGGTGQYIKELLGPSETLHVPADPKLRAKLGGYSLEQLQQELIRINVSKWESMNQSDRNNSRRLLRAIEVTVTKSKKNHHLEKNDPSNSVLVIGLTAPKEIIYDKIVERRRKRPDLVETEFKLAKKQLLYMKKYLQPIWFDITKPNFRKEIFSRVEEWYTKSSGQKKT